MLELIPQWIGQERKHLGHQVGRQTHQQFRLYSTQTTSLLVWGETKAPQGKTHRYRENMSHWFIRSLNLTFTWWGCPLSARMLHVDSKCRVDLWWEETALFSSDLFFLPLSNGASWPAQRTGPKITLANSFPANWRMWAGPNNMHDDVDWRNPKVLSVHSLVCLTQTEQPEFKCSQCGSNSESFETAC